MIGCWSSKPVVVSSIPDSEVMRTGYFSRKKWRAPFDIVCLRFPLYTLQNLMGIEKKREINKELFITPVIIHHDILRILSKKDWFWEWRYKVIGSKNDNLPQNYAAAMYGLQRTRACKGNVKRTLPWHKYFCGVNINSC